MPAGGCVSQRPKNAEGLCGNTRDNECCSRRLLPRSCYRYSSLNLASKRENGWGGSQRKEIITGPLCLRPWLKLGLLGPRLGRKTVGFLLVQLVFKPMRL